MARDTIIKLMTVVGVVGILVLSAILYEKGVPLWLGYLLSVSLVTLLAYGFDKIQAKAKRTRVPEFLLHLLALVGGTLGALIGQNLFRHKTTKPSFRRTFWGTIVLQILGLAIFLYWRSRS